MAESTEVAFSEQQTARVFIEKRVAERVRRNTAEQVQDTCSFARAERLLGREYHGRFLIELLQNAADAWRESRPDGARSRARIVLDDRSVACSSRIRACRSRRAQSSSRLARLAVRRRRRAKRSGIRGLGSSRFSRCRLGPSCTRGCRLRLPPWLCASIRSARWSSFGRIRLRGMSTSGRLVTSETRSPPCRFSATRCGWRSCRLKCRELASDGFDTVIRLPFDDQLRPEPNVDRGAWVDAVRNALSDLTDEMLLLLGTFDRLEIVDRLDGHDQVIEPSVGGGDRSCRGHHSRTGDSEPQRVSDEQVAPLPAHAA